MAPTVWKGIKLNSSKEHTLQLLTTPEREILVVYMQKLKSTVSMSAHKQSTWASHKIEWGQEQEPEMHSFTIIPMQVIPNARMFHSRKAFLAVPPPSSFVPPPHYTYFTP